MTSVSMTLSMTLGLVGVGHATEFALCSSGRPAGRMARLVLSAVSGAAVDFHRHRRGR